MAKVIKQRLRPKRGALKKKGSEVRESSDADDDADDGWVVVVDDDDEERRCVGFRSSVNFGGCGHVESWVRGIGSDASGNWKKEGSGKRDRLFVIGAKDGGKCFECRDGRGESGVEVLRWLEGVFR